MNCGLRQQRRQPVAKLEALNFKEARSHLLDKLKFCPLRPPTFFTVLTPIIRTETIFSAFTRPESPTETHSGAKTCLDRLHRRFDPPQLQMAQYYGAPPNQGYAPTGAQNLQFYPSTYSQPVSGHATPSQASYGYSGSSSGGGFGVSSGFNSGFGSAAGVSGRMGEQGGLRTGWIAAFSSEGYDGEPPLLEELGVNLGHVRSKVHRPGILMVRCAG